MFSPSLVSMMIHSVPPGLLVEAMGGVDEEARLFDVVTVLQRVSELAPTGLRWPLLPIVVRSRATLLQWGVDGAPIFDIDATIYETEFGAFLWGRVPLDVLIRAMDYSIEFSAAAQYVDLGTPIRMSGSGSSYDGTCAALLPRTAPHPPSGHAASAKVGVAIVDLGDSSGPQDDYRGQLRHAVPGIALSDHAEMVLSVLLERLDLNQILSSTSVSCALVIPPINNLGIGRSCFEQASTAEILNAVTALEPTLTSDNIPAAINMSLGTHVGPHNGESPFEEAVSRKLTANGRFVVAAAGNEDRFGSSAKCDLVAGEEESLTLVTGPQCEELLVEFWWKEMEEGQNLAIAAEIWEVKARGGRSKLSTIKIDRQRGVASLTHAKAGLPKTVIAHTLYASRCHNDFSCIAFALSATQLGAPGPFPPMQVFFALNSAHDMTVNAWVVIAESEPMTSFISREKVGTMTVPAVNESVVSVAGLQQNTGKVWNASSRGPGAQYDPAAPAPQVPLMAHIADLGGHFATSYASPRACADVAAALADPNKLPQCTDPKSLVEQAYNLTPGRLAWNERTGFHSQTS